jgi:hypothetical protein
MKQYLLTLIIFLFIIFIYGSDRIATYGGKKLLEGKGNGIMISEKFISNGYNIKKVTEADEEYFNSVCIKNNILYIGTGISGKIYKVSNNNIELFIDSIGGSIKSLTIKEKEIFAGTSPEGKLFKININDKSIETYYTKETAINDMFALNGSILLATSPAGKIFEFKNGQLKLWKQFDVTSINRIVKYKGKLYIICSDPAIIFITDIKGNVIKNYQFCDDEISDVVFSGDTLFTAINTKSNVNKFKSIVYKSDINFNTNIILAEFKGIIYSMGILDRSLILSIGELGHLYSLKMDELFKVHEIDDLMITIFSSYKDGLIGLSSHKGTLYKIIKNVKGKGVYTTEPIFFKNPVRFARIETNKKGDIRTFYRVSNNKIIDTIPANWKRYSKSSITGENPSTYMQIKYILGYRSKIYGYSLYYRERNNPPVIDSFVLSPPGVVYPDGKIISYPRVVPKIKKTRLKKSGFNLNPRAKDAENHKRSITVYAKDKDTDPIFYTIFLNSKYFKKKYLLIEHDTLFSFVIETDKYPDGTYTLYIKTEDSEGISDSLETEPFIIDNNPPDINIISAKKGGLKATITDTVGVYSIRYTIDGTEWNNVDISLYDLYGKKVKIEIPIEKITPFIIIDIMDLYGNHRYYNTRIKL